MAQRRRKQRLAVGVAAMMAIAVTALPAWAAQESGYQDCDGSYRVHVRNYGSGTLANYTPDGTLQGTMYAPMTTIYTTGSSYLNASWRATASGYMNYTGTYGYCD